jgi:hypothetical protein
VRRIELLTPEFASFFLRQLKETQQICPDRAAYRYIGRKSAHHHETRRGCRRHDRLVGKIALERPRPEQWADIDKRNGVIHAMFNQA